jgi:hypothetical protein
MIEDAQVTCNISCPHAPESYQADFRLEYQALYTENAERKRDDFEHMFRIEHQRSVFVRFSEGSVVQFGHLPLFPAWANVLKRKLGSSETEFYWGYRVCELMPTMGYSSGRVLSRSAGRHDSTGYCGNYLFLEFIALLSHFQVSSQAYFGRGGSFSTHQLSSCPA